MYLIKQDIVDAGFTAFTLFCKTYGIDPADLLNVEKSLPKMRTEDRAMYADAIDFAATALCARYAQTFIFDAEQIMAFLRAVDRKLAHGNYEVPFTEMIIQFSAPIPEREFLTGYHTAGVTPGPDELDDAVLGIVLGFPGDRGHIVNVIAYYKSGSINRATMDVSGDGSITSDVIVGTGSDLGMQDKQRIANLGMLCLAYLNSPGIEVERMAFPEKLNRRREREGKRPLEPYYLCKVAKQHYAHAGAGESSGRHVSFRFDVSGHFRRLPDGRMVWVRAHQRGLEHGLYQPKVYVVEKPQDVHP